VYQVEDEQYGYIDANAYPSAKIRFIIEAISHNVVVARYEVTTSGKTCFDVGADITKLVKQIKRKK
jgi:hypothetical protein